jgi:hypothetical protein
MLKSKKIKAFYASYRQRGFHPHRSQKRELSSPSSTLKGNTLVAPPTVEQGSSGISVNEKFLKKIFDLSSFPPILEVFYLL